MQNDLDITQTQVVEPSAEPSAESVPNPSVTQLADDALLPLKVGGKDITIPWSEARTGFQLHSDYTRKSQELAEQRRAFEAERQTVLSDRQQVQTQLEQLRSVMQNPQSLAALYMNVAAKQNAPAGPQPLTTESLPQLQQMLEQRMQERMQSFTTDFQQQQLASRIEQDFSNHTQGLLSKYPGLSAIDGAEDLVAGKVLAMQPKTPDEAKHYAATIIEDLAKRQTAAFAEQAKRDALAGQHARNGIEPRGGSPVLPKPQSFKSGAEREQAMTAFLDQLLSQ